MKTKQQRRQSKTTGLKVKSQVRAGEELSYPDINGWRPGNDSLRFPDIDGWFPNVDGWRPRGGK